MTGENAAFWRGGRLPYSPNFNNNLKEFVRNRDNGTCQECGALETNKAHDVHHIDYDKSNSDTNNLITLCESCHGKTVTNRTFWQKHFESYMAQRALEDFED